MNLAKLDVFGSARLPLELVEFTVQAEPTRREGAAAGVLHPHRIAHASAGECYC